MSTLRLGPKLALPLDAITETFGILAVRGAGKSNAAAVMAEEMYAAELPFVVIDPVGSWWGLRSSQDGKGPGLSIPIFGGKHGDVPLERTGGTLLADLIVEQRLSCVLDLSTFESEGAKKQFLLDFARRLYTQNTDPLHLFLEEADDYIPQRPMRDEAQLLRAWENIVRRGRARGLGITLITQRSAVLNKNVLEQVQTLIALRTTGPRDRAAIGDWLKYHAQSQEIIESLPSLRDGEAWIWSPDFLKLTTRVQVRRRQTFDSGQTPRMAKASRRPATLADVDLAKITKQMAATIERAKQTDPKVLQQEVARLRAELARKAPPKVEIQVKEVPILKDQQIQKLEVISARLSGVSDVLKGLMMAFGSNGRDHKFAPAKAVMQPAVQRPVTPSRLMQSVPQEGRLPEGERIILTAIEQANQTGRWATRQELTVVTGYKRSTRDAYLARLGQKGYVEFNGQQVRATHEGHAALGEFEPLPTGQALREYWIEHLPEGESKIFALLMTHAPMNAENITAYTGYKRSTRDAYLSRLRARHLITGDGRSGYKPSHHLYAEP